MLGLISITAKEEEDGERENLEDTGRICKTCSGIQKMWTWMRGQYRLLETHVLVLFMRSGDLVTGTGKF